MVEQRLRRARTGVRFFRCGEMPGAIDQADPVRRVFVQYGDPGETIRNDGAGRHLRVPLDERAAHQIGRAHV